ncbi:hypothetical protein H4R35_005061 [Dimargaris xerosporica]|nr:hypothetical protein H4R35_005061 [Dimargaris xerosporica]
MFVRATNQSQSNESQKPASACSPSPTSTSRDYSIAVTDAELFQACGGRTARKGARLLGQGDQGKLERTQTFATIASSTPVQLEDSKMTITEPAAKQSKKRQREKQESNLAKKAKEKKAKKKAKKSKRGDK